HARHVFVDNARNYGRAPAIEVFRDFIGDGLLTTDGELWRKHRRIIQPAFHAKALTLLAEAMTAVTARSLAQWREAGKDGAPIDVGEALSMLTNRIAGATLLGVDLEADTATVVRAAKTALAFINDRINSFVKLPLSIPTGANTRFLAAKADI